MLKQKSIKINEIAVTYVQGVADKERRSFNYIVNEILMGAAAGNPKHDRPTTTVATTKKPKVVKKKAVKPQIPPPLGFDQFWAAYPRKSDGRPIAVKAWTNLNANEEVLRTILIDIQARVNTGEWSDPKFIPMPSTYLNQGRWVGACHETKETKQEDAFMNVIKEMEEEDAAKERTYIER